MSERPIGYYWVRFNNPHAKWVIAKWDGDEWGIAFDEDPYTDEDLAEIGPRLYDYDGQPPSHDGDCTFHASKSNGHPTDGICTCGFGARRSRQGDDSQIMAEWRREVPAGAAIVLAGGLLGGYRAYGPFGDVDSATDWAQNRELVLGCQSVMPLVDPVTVHGDDPTDCYCRPGYVCPVCEDNTKGDAT